MDWNSSALWGIIGLIGGFIISFIFYKIGCKKKKVVYTQNSQTLITNNLSKIAGLNITYQGNPIENLTSTTITIKSIGKDIVEMSDFGKATPFCIKTDGEFLLQNNINSTITKNSNPKNLMELTIKNASTLFLKFDYLSQGDEITFVFLHTGTINVEGKLKTGSLLKYNIYQKISKVLDTIQSICLGIAAFLITIGYTVYSGVNGIFINIGNFLLHLLLGIILIKYFKKVFYKTNNMDNININIRDTIGNTDIKF